VIILGWVVSPAVVTTYVLTGYAARTAVGSHVFGAGAAMPGLGGLIGRGEQHRARAVRRELLTLTWLFATTVGVTVLCWNRSFLGLWVGQEHYGGPWLDLLIVLAAVQTVFIRTDAYVIDAALRPRPRVLAGAGAALVTIAVAVPLTRLFGAVGLCVGLLGGRAVQSAAYPLLVRGSLGSRGGPHWSEATRLAVVTALLFAAALFLGQRVRTSHWVVWGAGVALTAALAFVTALFAGPSGDGRRLVLTRLRGLRPHRPPAGVVCGVPLDVHGRRARQPHQPRALRPEVFPRAAPGGLDLLDRRQSDEGGAGARRRAARVCPGLWISRRAPGLRDRPQRKGPLDGGRAHVGVGTECQPQRSDPLVRIACGPGAREPAGAPLARGGALADRGPDRGRRRPDGVAWRAARAQRRPPGDPLRGADALGPGAERR